METIEVSKVGLYRIIDALLSQKHKAFAGKGGATRLIKTVFGEVDKKEKIHEVRSFMSEYRKEHSPERRPIPQSERLKEELRA